MSIDAAEDACALLREALPWVGHMSDDPDLGLRARIAAFLEKRPFSTAIRADATLAATLAERERAADMAEHLGDNEIAAAIRRAER